MELPDLLRVMLKLAKRRGYAGAFRVRSEGKQGPVQAGVSALQEAMRAAGCRTLGEYLNYRFERGESLKLKEAGLYAHREMLVAEFNAIWDEQQWHHPILRSLALIRSILGAALARFAINSSTPSSCSDRSSRSPRWWVTARLNPACRALPRRSRHFRQFRLSEKQLADLRWGMGRAATPLSGRTARGRSHTRHARRTTPPD
ncbi:MAG: hypothetical protein RML56_14200 [Burkholderiales bacterium]|nr:hypothetical protein [Burkholderiales bacterium]